jgi:RNA polymerase sigma-70 factor, ECF subfamily
MGANVEIDPAAPDNDILVLLQGCELEHAFALLFERYEGKVYRLCCSMLRDATQAEDAAQESWVRVSTALASYDRRASLSTWIYAITRNRCLTAIERRRYLVSMSTADIEAEITALEVGQVDPEDLSALLREFVEFLPERYRRVLTLFYYEDRSVSEVAKMLAMPEGTVKTLLNRARAALGEQLRRRGLDDPSAWWDVQP